MRNIIYLDHWALYGQILTNLYARFPSNKFCVLYRRMNSIAFNLGIVRKPFQIFQSVYSYLYMLLIPHLI
jgi:hypothetical protein